MSDDESHEEDEELKPTNEAAFELYRKSTVGICLTEALDELIQSGSIPPELAMKVLGHFDRSVNKTLANKVKNKVTFKGHLHTYRYCDNVWTLIMEDATFKTDTETITVDKVKLVACDGMNKTITCLRTLEKLMKGNTPKT